MSMQDYKNFAYGRVIVAPSPATSGTTLTLAAGQGARMPTPPFHASVWPADAYPDPDNAEIVDVTGLAGDVLTIARAVEGTTARAIVNGDVLAATITKDFIDQLRNLENLTVSPTYEVPYSGALFSTEGGVTWTVGAIDYLTYWYQIVGRMCVVNVALANFSLLGNSVSGASLYIALPDGVIPTTRTRVETVLKGDDPGLSYTYVYAEVRPASPSYPTAIKISKMDNGAFANFTADSCHLCVQLAFPIEPYPASDVD